MAAFAPKEERLIFGEISDECKSAVVGIDFGTAYSGTAITFKAQPNAIRPCAPGVVDPVQIKVPTSLLLKQDGEWVFGAAAESGYSNELNGVDKGEHPVQLFKRFKMVLKGKNTGFDTLTAMSIAGQHHSLLDLITISLRILKENVMRKAAEGFAGILSIEDIQWVLTVPAIWNDFGKAFMRKAAFKAGMTSTELSENLLIVLEPEAAALAIYASMEKMNFMNLGSRFMVLDCGGGTVDITAHEVRSVSPKLRLSSIAIPGGGAWGGDFVNLEFQKFLRNLFGTDVFEDNSNAYCFYAITEAFDVMKKAYDPKDDPIGIRMKDVLEDNPRLVELVGEYNKNFPEKPITSVNNNGFVKMSKALMMSFFDTFLDNTVAATRQMLKDTPGIHTIMLVGGFGSSRVMIDRIRDEFHGKRGMTVILPISPGPQAAIVHGAVYFGLYKNIIETRLSPYTYGIAMRIGGVPDSFHVLVQRGQELPEDHMAEQAGMPGSAAQTALSWRVFRSNLVEPKTVKGETLLGTLPVKCPPNPNNLLRLQRARFYFGGPEIVVKVVNATNEEYTAQIVPPPDAPVPPKAAPPKGP